MIRTRFAPSPTGYLHLGGARTALFNWAYSRRHGGKFILRIEDTDLERSTQESEQAIFDAMNWLGLDWDEGPFFQMKRLGRYKEVAEEMLKKGLAYWAYETKEELEAMREGQQARGEKPRYDRRWRDSKDAPPAGRTPVLRFKNPLSGDVTWNDLVKGPITVSNDELDDLVLLRTDGVPTYNFGVVVDDIDMDMTHVIRGDDHVNNTPRQINLYRALGAELPHFGHMPMILGSDGQRLSKRHGAVNVMQYKEDGFLPDAMVNYLARLGWSHGDDEVFSREQLVEWFDLEHVSRSPARWDPEKLRWLNGEYLRRLAPAEIAQQLREERPSLMAEVESKMDPAAMLATAIGDLDTFRMVETYLHEMAQPVSVDARLRETHLGPKGVDVLGKVAPVLEGVEWQAPAISAAFKSVVQKEGLKMPEVMMPVRVAVTGREKTKAIDGILAAFRRDEVLARIRRATSA